ncbi:MAG TPA: hypothetical protein VHT28_18960, partial [Silvibacterium sp.]|nr:hypothetical protein [Silvibacterium sp.]
LAYKLSFYDPPQASSRHMPAAKLLSSRERPKTAMVEFQESSSIAFPLTICVLFAVLLPLLTAKAQPHGRCFALA